MGIRTTFINSLATIWNDRDLNSLQRDLQLEGVINNNSFLVQPVSGQMMVEVLDGGLYINATVPTGLTSVRCELDAPINISVPTAANTYYVYLTISSTVPNAAGEGAATLNIGTSVPVNSYQLAHFDITVSSTEVTNIIDDRELFDRYFRATGDGNVLPYNPTSSYTVDNIVEYNNALYQNIVACTGVEPTDESNWVAISSSSPSSIQIEAKYPIKDNQIVLFSIKENTVFPLLIESYSTMANGTPINVDDIVSDYDSSANDLYVYKCISSHTKSDAHPTNPSLWDNLGQYIGNRMVVKTKTNLYDNVLYSITHLPGKSIALSIIDDGIYTMQKLISYNFRERHIGDRDTDANADSNYFETLTWEFTGGATVIAIYKEDGLNWGRLISIRTLENPYLESTNKVFTSPDSSADVDKVGLQIIETSPRRIVLFLLVSGNLTAHMYEVAADNFSLSHQASLSIIGSGDDLLITPEAYNSNQDGFGYVLSSNGNDDWTLFLFEATASTALTMRDSILLDSVTNHKAIGASVYDGGSNIDIIVVFMYKNYIITPKIFRRTTTSLAEIATLPPISTVSGVRCISIVMA